MITERQKIDYALEVLRQQYSPASGDTIDQAAQKLTDLKALRASTFTVATKTVTIKSVGYEGGTGSGDITFEKVILGMAINELLAEIDPNYISAPGSRVILPDRRLAG